MLEGRGLLEFLQFFGGLLLFLLLLFFFPGRLANSWRFGFLIGVVIPDPGPIGVVLCSSPTEELFPMSAAALTKLCFLSIVPPTLCFGAPPVAALLPFDLSRGVGVHHLRNLPLDSFEKAPILGVVCRQDFPN